MRCVARELGPKNSCVNLVHPGLTDTGGIDEEYLRASGERRFIRRAGLPTDLAGAVVFLASAESSFITGQQIVVDGGLMLT